MLSRGLSMRNISTPRTTVVGKVHSIETCGTVDGPGIRCVIFLQGCPLRCRFCHNPDTWKIRDGIEMTAERIFSEIRKYRSYFRYSNGGVTLTGGEPLMQPGFVADILRLCKLDKIHTAIDTSGYINYEKSEEAIQLADLIMLDLKCINPVIHKQLTGVDLDPVLSFARRLSEIGKRMWIRHVLVPGITDDDIMLNELAGFINTLKNVEMVEILPYHKMAEFKWMELGESFGFSKLEPPSEQRLSEVKGIFSEKGISVH